MLKSDGQFVRSPLGLTGIELLAGQVRHLADELGVEKTSVPRLGLIRLGLKRGQDSWIVVQARGGSLGRSQPQDGYNYGSGDQPHPAPPFELEFFDLRVVITCEIYESHRSYTHSLFRFLNSGRVVYLCRWSYLVAG